MGSHDDRTAGPERKGRLWWVTAAAVLGLSIGLFAPLAAVLVRPNEKPTAILKDSRMMVRRGHSVTVDATLSHVPNRPDARLRFEWSDPEDHLLSPAMVDAEGPAAQSLVVYGVDAGPREIILRVTHTSRCHRFARLWMSAVPCEVSDEARAFLYVRPANCRPGSRMPADELILEDARVIRAEDRDGECRLVLPKLIVTNGHRLEIRDEVPVETPEGGTRIIGFREGAANAGVSVAGTDAGRARDGQVGIDGGNGSVGGDGQNGRDAGPVVMVAPTLIGHLSIENNGQGGGRGGIGGRGGLGGRGGNAIMGSVNACDRLISAQAGGKGGTSGAGGPGGRGGNAGEVRIEFTQSVAPPHRLTVAADGGGSGPGGPTGYQGRGGIGGFDAAGVACAAGPDGPAGQDGQRGPSGSAGPMGAAARISVRNGAEESSRPPDQGRTVSLPNPP
jgi:hypothetical protein